MAQLQKKSDGSISEGMGRNSAVGEEKHEDCNGLLGGYHTTPSLDKTRKEDSILIELIRADCRGILERRQATYHCKRDWPWEIGAKPAPP
jgi:hypothetical protein